MTTTAPGSEWVNVTQSQPCQFCGKGDWCTIRSDGAFAICQRTNTGQAKEKKDKNGATYFLYQLKASETKWPEPCYSLANSTGRKADADTLHRVYDGLLQHLPLNGRHIKALQERGLHQDGKTSSLAKSKGYRTHGPDRAKAAVALVRLGLEEHLPHVPGFYVQDGKGANGGRFWSLAGPGGLLIPIRDHKRRIVALLVRPDEPRPGSGKYLYLSSKKRGGAGPGAPIHFPLFEGDTATVRITEGALKADLATFLSGILTIGLPGVSIWRGAGKALQMLKAKTVRLAFDADALTNLLVAKSLESLAKDLVRRELAVELERWSIEDGKGIDDLLLGGKQPEVITGDQVLPAIAEIVQAAKAVTIERIAARVDANGSDNRPVIEITTEEHEVNEQAAAALCRDSGIYQRGGVLVRIIRDVPLNRGIHRPAAPRIDPLPSPVLRERLTACASWTKTTGKGENAETKPAHPPDWCISAVHARGHWPNVRRLEAVVDHPILRPDGTVLSLPGYDPDTGLLLEFNHPPLPMPENPTRDDAVRAAQLLLEVIADFPVERPVHRASWLAAVLTPLARHAFHGPAPLFLVDANIRGAGKGLMLDAGAHIVTGQRHAVAIYTPDDEEMRKRITSLALAGDHLVLLDNLEGKLGNAALDAVLTATSWKDRLLGTNRTVDLPLFITWFATGNNVLVGADTARRICHIRLESPEERPEQRQTFRHPHLLTWVAENRFLLLAAALTILRAYCAAGRPDQKLPAWGSYEAWSALVRGAIVWAGLPDPGESRFLLQEHSDSIAENMALILQCLRKLDPHQNGWTAAQMVQWLKSPPSLTEAEKVTHATLHDAVESLLGQHINSQRLGYRLRAYRRRVLRGLFLDRAGSDHQAVRWAAYPASEFRRRAEDAFGAEGRIGNCETTVCDPLWPTSPAPCGEDGEDGEHVSPGGEAVEEEYVA